MTYFLWWLLPALISFLWADSKGLQGWKYFLLGVIIGPFSLLAVWVAEDNHKNLIEPANAGAGIRSMEDFKRELQSIRYSSTVLEGRIQRLEAAIGSVEAVGQQSAPVSTDSFLESLPKIAPKFEQPPRQASARMIQPAVVVHAPVSSEGDVDFIRFWLNKIGMGILLLGIAFLITYSFQYMGAVAKVLFGYGLSGLMFFVGARLEKNESWKQHGRVLLIGGWALVYFITFAIYHFPAVKIIHSSTVEIGLLCLIAGLMVRHALRYKEESVMAGALFFAYLTTTIIHVNEFTFLSTTFLAGLLLVFVYWFNWHRLLMLGGILTFGVHYAWVDPHLPFGRDGDVLSLLFLTGYWIVFMLGSHMVALRSKDPKTEKIALGINGASAVLYLMMGFPVFMDLFEAHRFQAILGLGIVYVLIAFLMRRLKCQRMALSDLVIGISAITLAIPLRFSAHETLLVWFVEAPLLLFFGKLSQEKIYRLLGDAVAVVSLLWLFMRMVEDSRAWTSVAGQWSAMTTLCLFAAISMLLCFCVYHVLKRPEDDPYGVADMMSHGFSLASAVLFGLMLATALRGLNISLALVLFSVGWWLLSFVFNLKRFRFHGYLAMAVPALDLIFYHQLSSPVLVSESVLTASFILVAFALYSILKWSDADREDADFEKIVLFSLGAFLVGLKTYQALPDQWATLGWGICGMVLAVLGILLKDVYCRISGICFFALVILRLIVVDMAQLNIIFKIVTFIVLGCVFLGVSFLYNRLSIGKNGSERIQ